MLEQLRGRNLAHVGCTFGLLVGLVVGMIAGTIIVILFSGPAAVNWATGVWIGLTAVLGIAGYLLGSWATERVWGETRRDD